MKTNYQKENLQYFFCIGCQKSGTTLLAKTIDRHPNIACIFESYALKNKAQPSIMNLDSFNWSRHGFAEDDVRSWSKYWSSKSKISLRILRRLTGYNYPTLDKFRQTMSHALNDFANRCGVSIVGDKWPWYIDYIDLVVKAFPDAKFIYSVRDPRGIWNSAQRFKERQRGDEILCEMLDKDRKISPYLERANFLTIRYEDLVCNPEDTTKRIYQFLGANFSKDYLIDKEKADPYPERWNWIPEATSQFNPRNTIKWQEQINANDIACITELADWFIEKYQYSQLDDSVKIN